MLKSLRRWVDFTDGQPFIATEAMIDTQPFWSAAAADEVRLLEWVKQNWQEIKALEKARAVSSYELAKAMSDKQTHVLFGHQMILKNSCTDCPNNAHDKSLDLTEQIQVLARPHASLL